jgi:hypothetical protein
MSGTIPLTIKMSPQLKKELQKVAKKLGLKPSAAARTFIEEGITRHQPGGLLGSMKGSAQLAADYDPSEPVFPPEDWSDSAVP